MDTSNGRVYKDFETAYKDGADKDDLIVLDVDDLERNKMLVGVLKFLIKDNAFSEDFLLTTIFEYICNSTKEGG